MNNICEENRCTGCFTCYNVCPKGCITMCENEMGCIVPKINTEECLQCSLCVKSCPQNSESDFKRPMETYAAWNLDNKDREDSTSGGAATIFAKNIIKQNGIVFGSQYDENLNVVNKPMESIDQIEKLKGSKYAQSYIGHSYKKAKEYLKKDKRVIFIGTPCQIDGLKFFLKEEYENLITVDLVCHGVPPMKYLREHVESINKRLKKDITDVRFRGKYDEKLTLFSNKKLIYLRELGSDSYFRGFYGGLTCRESCYHCKYARPERIGDITIGDFWGLEDLKLQDRGVERASLVLINTQKGEKFFEECKEDLFCVKRTLEEAINTHAQMNVPTAREKHRDEFEKYYVTDGFEKAINKCIGRRIFLRRIKLKIKLLFGI